MVIVKKYPANVTKGRKNKVEKLLNEFQFHKEQKDGGWVLFTNNNEGLSYTFGPEWEFGYADEKPKAKRNPRNPKYIAMRTVDASLNDTTVVKVNSTFWAVGEPFGMAREANGDFLAVHLTSGVLLCRGNKTKVQRYIAKYRMHLEKYDFSKLDSAPEVTKEEIAEYLLVREW